MHLLQKARHVELSDLSNDQLAGFKSTDKGAGVGLTFTSLEFSAQLMSRSREEILFGQPLVSRWRRGSR